MLTVLSVSLSISAASMGMTLPPLQPKAGDPIPGLTPSQLSQFNMGRSAYSRPFTAAEGLGPAFNATNCAACHESPVGGWGATRVRHFGRLEADGSFNFLESLGGPVLQRTAISPSCLETVPAAANHTRERVTPSVLAFGLVEALTDAQIQANADPNDSNGDGVSGRVHMVRPIEAPPTAPLRAGRFGWKAQIATVLSFAGDAARTEMGITNRVVADETAPNGNPITLATCDLTADPEARPASNGVEFVDSITAFQRFLAPPPQSPRTGMSGESVFNSIGCAKCHVPSFTTPNDPALESALRNKSFRPYSDFLLHDMGDMLADGIGDGIPDGSAGRFEMKTPPLWNLRTRPVMLHDGSAVQSTLAAKVEFAVSRHGGEGASARAAFQALSAGDRAKLFAFLDSLGRDEFDINGDTRIDSEDYALLVSCIGSGTFTADSPCAVADINGNGLIDEDERAYLAREAQVESDCNQNGVADHLDIINGVSRDENGNGTPDECDTLQCEQRVIRLSGTGGAIPDNTLNGITSTIGSSQFPESGTVQRLTVGLRLHHTWLSDLRVSLQRSNTSEKSILVGTICTDCEKFAANVDGLYWFGQGPGITTPCEAPASAFQTDPDNPDCQESTMLLPGTYRVPSPSAATWFNNNGSQVRSGWTLRVGDQRANDAGTLDSWLLNIVYLPDSLPDCDDDGVSDRCAIADGAFDDDRNGIPDSCQIAANGTLDCNGNGRLDTSDVLEGGIADCNGNGRPDSCEPDTDGDGVIDACDECPLNPGRVTTSECGCGPVTDSDGDGTPDCIDFCPNDPAKLAPGLCGCGIADTDSDGDGTPNCFDGCPNDPAKLAPGACGCGAIDLDTDHDGTADCVDGCPNDPHKTAPGGCGCGIVDTDSDGDHREDCRDNCPQTPNAAQADCDSDGVGDACETDAVDCNANGVPDSCDISSGHSPDANHDGIPDECDDDCDGNGVTDADEVASGSASDCNGNGLPDSCDIARRTSTDLDDDGVPDECPGEFVVGGTGYQTIQAALEAAPSGTTIRVSRGNYAGPLVIEGKSIRLSSLADPEDTTIDGTGLDVSILSIVGEAANGSFISGFRFVNGTAGTAAPGERIGGAIRIQGASATVRYCIFDGNHAGSGGAIHARGFSGAIEECRFVGNLADHDGGALWIGLGGSWVLDHCVFEDNSALGGGGAVAVFDGEGTEATAGTLFTCAFRGNSASGDGGALAWLARSGSDLRVTDCSVFGNTGGAGAFARLDASQPTTLQFNIVRSRFCGNTETAVSGPFIDGGANTFGTDCDANGVCDSEQIAAGTAADCDGDGLLDSCAIAQGTPDCNGNGRPDACDIASGGSPDIDHDGVPDECASDCNGNGVPDPLDIADGTVPDCNGNIVPDACDIFNGTSSDLNGNGIPDDCAGELVVGGSSRTSLQAAVSMAANGQTIVVGPGTYTGALSIVGKSLTIRSSAGAASTVLVGTGLDSSIMAIRESGANGSTVDGFTFTGGLVGSTEFGTRVGGALLLLNTEANIRHCIFSGNRANYGGALYALGFSGAIEDCEFRSNHAIEDSGAVQFGFGGTVRFAGNQLVGNSCGRNGGALQVVQWFEGPSTTALVAGCSFRDNTAVGTGTALAWYAGGGSGLPVSNCAFEGNTGSTAALARLGASGTVNLAFQLSDTRFCRNAPRNIDGPVADGGGNVFGTDCNANGICDSDEIAQGTAADCNSNGVIDACDIASGIAKDCNSNGRPDSCDLAAGTSTDLDGNGRLDECSGELVVGGSGFASIQSAVDAAPASGATVLVGAGTYSGSTIDLSGKSISLRAIAGPSATILDGAGLAGPIVRVLSSGEEGSSIIGFTLRHGTHGQGASPSKGGAIYVATPAPNSVLFNIYSCVFESNAADLGGAIYAERLVTTIQGCEFRGNSATQGGALYLQRGSWVVRVCTITDGVAQAGGGIYSSSPITGFVTLTTISGNTADAGSAIYSVQTTSSDLVLTNSQVEFNTGAAGAALQNVSATPIIISSVRLCANEPQSFLGIVTDLGWSTVSEDCNANHICDAEEILNGTVLDCNDNEIPDSCDIAAGAPDINGNGAIDDCEHLGDLDDDGVVGASDLALMLTAWGSNGAAADLNGDGLVGGADIALLLQRWGL